jgi:adenosine deaminase
VTINSLPKVELHLHLEGGAPPAFIKGLAKEKKIDISGIFNEDGSYRFTDFWNFLKVYEAACTTLTGPQEFYRLTPSSPPISAAVAILGRGANICTRSRRPPRRRRPRWGSR